MMIALSAELSFLVCFRFVSPSCSVPAEGCGLLRVSVILEVSCLVRSSVILASTPHGGSKVYWRVLSSEGLAGLAGILYASQDVLR